MQELKLDLENCYGIKKMKETIDYSKNNVAIIYAPNGTMKSSLAKTFETTVLKPFPKLTVNISPRQ